MSTVLLRACGLWVLLVVLAIVNGIMREKLLVPLLGQSLALPLSGISLSMLIFLITVLLSPFLRATISSQYWIVGGMWVLLTVLFEFSFGHYIMAESWHKLFEKYNLLEGNLWILVLITTAVSPYLAAKLRGLA